jgi:hypothetical protein
MVGRNICPLQLVASLLIKDNCLIFVLFSYLYINCCAWGFISSTCLNTIMSGCLFSILVSFTSVVRCMC